MVKFFFRRFLKLLKGVCFYVTFRRIIFRRYGCSCINLSVVVRRWSRYSTLIRRLVYELDDTTCIPGSRVPGSGRCAIPLFPCLHPDLDTEWAVALGIAALIECAHPECLTIQDERLRCASCSVSVARFSPSSMKC